MDARVKIIITLAFLICLNISPDGAWPAFILFFTLLVIELLLSQIPLKIVLTRSLISLPFLLAAFPLLIIDQGSQLEPNSWFSISQTGLIRFLSIILKSWLSIMAAILLTSTTSFQELMRGLRQLGIPQMIVALLSLMWRYLSLMVDEALTLMKARNCRSGKADNKHRVGGTIWWRGMVTGKMAGNLLIRSFERSERVYAAMAARGYNGQILQTNDHMLTLREILPAMIGCLLSVIILGIALVFH